MLTQPFALSPPSKLRIQFWMVVLLGDYKGFKISCEICAL